MKMKNSILLGLFCLVSICSCKKSDRRLSAEDIIGQYSGHYDVGNTDFSLEIYKSDLCEECLEISEIQVSYYTIYKLLVKIERGNISIPEQVFSQEVMYGNSGGDPGFLMKVYGDGNVNEKQITFTIVHEYSYGSGSDLTWNAAFSSPQKTIVIKNF